MLRLARMLNFIKSLLDQGLPVPDACPAEVRVKDPADRLDTGKRVLSRFLADGRIYGVTPEGKVFEHQIAKKLSRQFLAGLSSIDIRGSK